MTSLRLLWPCLGALACAQQPCPKGSFYNSADGLCYLEDDEPDGNTGSTASTDTAEPTDSGAPTDTSEPTGPVTLADRCDPPELPADPITDLGEFDLQSRLFAEAVDIEIDPDRELAVLVGQGGLMVLDIANPEAPEWLSFAADTAFRDRFYHLELADRGLVYATHWEEGLAVIDISDPRFPSVTTSLSAEGWAGMARGEDVLYVVDQTGALVVFDTTDAGNPVELTGVEGLAAPVVPHRQGERLYVADNSLGIAVFDISTPALPVLLTTVEAGASVQDLAFSEDGSTLYAAAGGAGVQVWSLSDPDLPVLTETIDLAYSVISVDTAGELLWAVDQQDIVAIDISVPASPTVLSTRQTGQWSMHVAADGDRAWVADWGWLRGYSASGEPAGDLNPAADRLLLSSSGGTRTLSLRNTGGAPVELTGLTLSDDRLTATVSDDTIPAGDAVTLSIDYDTTEGSGNLDATVCIAATDPDEPIQELQLVDGAPDDVGIGSPAPDFTLTTLDGDTVRLSDQRGRPVVLAYFATW